MSTALWVSFAAFVLFAIAAGFLLKAADRPGDDFGAVFPGLFAAAVSVVAFLVWVILLVVKVWQS